MQLLAHMHLMWVGFPKYLVLKKVTFIVPLSGVAFFKLLGHLHEPFLEGRKGSMDLMRKPRTCSSFGGFQKQKLASTKGMLPTIAFGPNNMKNMQFIFYLKVK
jgi:hypothetical protein